MIKIVKFQDVKDKYFEIVNNIDETDICVYYVDLMNDWYRANITELKIIVKQWKNDAEKGHLSMIIENNHTKTIQGVEWHILVVQSEGLGPAIGGFVFDSPYMVNGWVYMFKSKYTRDTIFNWINKNI